MRNIKLLDFAFAAGTALSLILAGFSEFSEQAERVQGEVLRLHIPANSDSERDQQLKLMLRDELLTEYGKRLSDSGSLSAAEQRAEQLLPEIEQFANGFLAENGADYSARAELTEMDFSTREYDSVTLPAGNYKALRITLGSGEGHNWWCIMFPPLCLPCAAKPAECESVPAEAASPDGSALATFQKPQKIKVKFAVYEWIKSLLD